MYIIACTRAFYNQPRMLKEVSNECYGNGTMVLKYDIRII